MSRTTRTISAAEFNRRPSAAKRAAESGSVVVTERGRPSVVLVSYDEYERLRGTPANLSTWLEMDDDIEFEIEPVGIEIAPAQL